MKELGTMPYVAAGFGLFFMISLIFTSIMPFFLLSIFLLIAGIIIYDAGTGTPRQQYTMRDNRASHSTNDHLAKMFSKAVSTSRSAHRPYTPPQTQEKDSSANNDKNNDKQASAPSGAVMVIIGLLAIWLMVS